MRKEGWLIGFLFATICLVWTSSLALGTSYQTNNPNMKTVEFFIGQMTNASHNNNSVIDYTFSFWLPELDVAKNYGWIELNGVTRGDVDLLLHVNLSNRYHRIFSIDSAGETQRFLLRYPFYFNITNGSNGPYNLRTYIPNAASAVQLESAKLILTYEYDKTSPRQLKTIRYFGMSNNSFLTNSTPIVAPVSVFVPEELPVIQSAFIEVTGMTQGAGAVTNMTINTTLGVPLRVVVNGTAATQSFFVLYNATEFYPITSPQTLTTTFNFNSSGNPIYGLGAQTVLTYEYNANSTNQMNTIRLLAGSSNNSFASTALIQFNFSVPIAESDISVQSAYLAFTGFMTAVKTNMIMNVSGTVWRNFTIIPNTEGTDMYLIYNASQQLSSLTGGGFVNGPYSFNVRPVGPAIGVPSAELFLTYNYTNDTVMRTKTLHYSPFSEVTQRLAGAYAETYAYFFIPELNVSMKSLYLESSSITSAVAAHVLTCTIDDTERLYSQQNTGETTFSYYLHNFTKWNYGATTGDNGAILIGKRDSAISSVDSGEVIGTYFFQ